MAKMKLPAWAKDKKLLAFGGAGVGLGLLVYLRRKNAAGAGGATETTGQTIQPAVADSSGVDAYNNLQNEIENLQGQISAIQIPSAQQAVAPKPWSPPGNLLRLGAPTGKSMTVAAKAQQLHISVGLLERLNPNLKGHKTVPPGTQLIVPYNR